MGKVSIEDPFLIGQHGVLSCAYDLEGCELYSVKWYKDGQEFYRFMPMPSMPDHMDMFKVAGVTIDQQKSHKNTLHLVNIERNTEGIFRCEVSTESPHFYTVVEEVSVTVVGENCYVIKNNTDIFCLQFFLLGHLSLVCSLHIRWGTC